MATSSLPSWPLRTRSPFPACSRLPACSAPGRKPLLGLCLLAYRLSTPRHCYALVKQQRYDKKSCGRGVIPLSVGATFVAACGLTLVATAGRDILPAIMLGSHYTPAIIFVVWSIWVLSLAALVALWQRRPHSVLDMWLMVVLCAWVCDIGLSAVFNAGRFDLGFYAGRVYGLLATSFVLIMLVVENSRLYSRLIETHEGDRQKAAELPRLTTVDALTGIGNRQSPRL